MTVLIGLLRFAGSGRWTCGARIGSGVHTSSVELAQGEAEIQRIGTRLRQEGQLT